MQIKTTMRHHFIPVRMAFTKKTRDNKCWWGCREKGSLVHCRWECKLMQLLWETLWRVLKKLKRELPYDLAIPRLDIYPKELKTGYQRDIHTAMFFAALFTIANMWKPPNCPSMDEWIKKIYIYMCVCVYICIDTHTHTRIWYSHEKEGNVATCDMNRPWGHYAKWGKSDRERQVMYAITYKWHLQKSNLRKKESRW